MRRTFSRTILTSLREMPSEDVFASLAIHYKSDPTYSPIKDSRSRRWQVRTTRGEFEILTTGPQKWYDTRAEKGGGGAIDLAMHLLEVSFLDAVKLLAQRERSHG